jgi:hypothetical protein
MSSYTLTIKEIVENFTGDDKLFDFEYPIYSEEYRAAFEEKFINHFYFREIGCETLGRFKFYLREKLNLIMPMYNKYYTSMNLEQRVLNNYQLTETFTKNTGDNVNVVVDSTQNLTTTEDNTSTSSGSGKELFSDTPQGALSLIGSPYVSSITEGTNENETVNDIDGTAVTDIAGTTVTAAEGTENYTRVSEGNVGVMTDAEAVKNFQDAQRNIDLIVFNECNDLFMQLY